MLRQWRILVSRPLHKTIFCFLMQSEFKSLWYESNHVPSTPPPSPSQCTKILAKWRNHLDRNKDFKDMGVDLRSRIEMKSLYSPKEWGADERVLQWVELIYLCEEQDSLCWQSTSENRSGGNTGDPEYFRPLHTQGHCNQAQWLMKGIFSRERENDWNWGKMWVIT